MIEKGDGGEERGRMNKSNGKRRGGRKKERTRGSHTRTQEGIQYIQTRERKNMHTWTPRIRGRRDRL